MHGKLFQRLHIKCFHLELSSCADEEGWEDRLLLLLSIFYFLLY